MDAISSSKRQKVSEGIGERSSTVTSTGSVLSYTDNNGPRTPRKGEVVVEERKKKTIFDRLYGSIEMEPLLIAVMDTEEFQRLDRIAQLGGSSYVYPSAKHSRKEHSIGVAHLAGKMVRRLRDSIPISDDDVLCVEVAGLCHDMGHGPYSHMWESVFSESSHEKMSQELVRRVAEKIKFGDYFQDKTRNHVEFVCELIEGGEGFLYDIVSNSRSGVDVDKIDYLQRDAMATLGTRAPFDINRLLHSCRVIDDQVWFEEKVAMDINSIFAMRADLHRQVYQHRVANVAELMITDVLRVADESDFRVCGARLSDAAKNPAIFVKLTDGILEAITMSTARGLEAAHAILDRLTRRDYYRGVGSGRAIPTLPLCANCSHETQIRDKFCAKCGRSTKDRDYVLVEGRRVPPAVDRSDKDWQRLLAERSGVDRATFTVVVSKVKRGWPRAVSDPYGNEWVDYDPIANVSFYNPKRPPSEWKKSPKLSKMYLPQRMLERVVYCYYKEKKFADYDRLEQAFNALFGNFAVDEGRSNINSPSPQRVSCTTPTSQLSLLHQAHRGDFDSPTKTAL
ncbi:hypothetical protein CTAYLR_006389 [Chrysophaeum taylorii]|uniref:HD domain-containing protein n=1 Tax=Chrysophaeum taylorii TaxID=2483200 RepID=A0AAD7U7F2_9STRA|nr:hypothetical protein CTAYLR_006389 [Chrysophaeum taylorii]